MFTVATLQASATVALMLVLVLCLVLLAAQLRARFLARADAPELAHEEIRPTAPSLRLVVSRRRRTECPYDWTVQGL